MYNANKADQFFRDLDLWKNKFLQTKKTKAD